MKTLHTRCHVGSSGSLSLALSAAEFANRDVDVVVLVRPLGLRSAHPLPAPGSSHITDEEWAALVRRASGHEAAISASPAAVGKSS